jgi:hypothetical protein
VCVCVCVYCDYNNRQVGNAATYNNNLHQLTTTGKWATLGKKDHGKGVQGGLLHSLPGYVGETMEAMEAKALWKQRLFLFRVPGCVCFHRVLICSGWGCSMLQHVAACCSMLQHVGWVVLHHLKIHLEIFISRCCCIISRCCILAYPPTLVRKCPELSFECPVANATFRIVAPC